MIIIKAQQTPQNDQGIIMCYVIILLHKLHFQIQTKLPHTGNTCNNNIDDSYIVYITLIVMSSEHFEQAGLLKADSHPLELTLRLLVWLGGSLTITVA